MTDTTTIDWKGGTRRIELNTPRDGVVMHHLSTAPSPLKMNPKTLAFLNTTIEMGTELEIETIEALPLQVGMNLVADVIKYWQTLEAPDEKSYKVEPNESNPNPFDSLDLNDDGSIDIEEMR